MEKAQMRVIHFDTNDVIATSGLMMSGLGNGKPEDNMFNGESLSNYAGDYFMLKGHAPQSGSDLIQYIDKFTEGKAYNGTYSNKTYSSSDIVPGESYNFERMYDIYSGTIYEHQ